MFGYEVWLGSLFVSKVTHNFMTNLAGFFFLIDVFKGAKGQGHSEVKLKFIGCHFVSDSTGYRCLTLTSEEAFFFVISS